MKLLSNQTMKPECSLNVFQTLRSQVKFYSNYWWFLLKSTN